jgi:hypothetical protein
MTALLSYVSPAHVDIQDSVFGGLHLSDALQHAK